MLVVAANEHVPVELGFGSTETACEILGVYADVEVCDCVYSIEGDPVALGVRVSLVLCVEEKLNVVGCEGVIEVLVVELLLRVAACVPLELEDSEAVSVTLAVALLS